MIDSLEKTIDENCCLQNSVNVAENHGLNKNVFEQFKCSQQTLPSSSVIDLCAESPPPKPITSKFQSKLLVRAVDITMSTDVPPVMTKKTTAPKPAKPKAPPKPPAKSKIEKDFDKLNSEQRLGLLKIWNEECKCEEQQASVRPSSFAPTADALPEVSKSSEEKELSSLRLQLNDVMNKIQDLQGREKKLKMAIKRLQRKVCANSSLGGLLAVDDLEGILTLLFKAPDPASALASRSKPPSHGIDKCGLWYLTQLCEGAGTALCTRQLVEGRYVSLEAANGYDEDSLAQLEKEEETCEEIIDTIEEMNDQEMRQEIKPSAAPSFLSQLVAEFSTQPAPCKEMNIEDNMNLEDIAPIESMFSLVDYSSIDEKAESMLRSLSPSVRSALSSLGHDLDFNTIHLDTLDIEAVLRELAGLDASRVVVNALSATCLSILWLYSRLKGKKSLLTLLEEKEKKTAETIATSESDCEINIIVTSCSSAVEIVPNNKRTLSDPPSSTLSSSYKKPRLQLPPLADLRPISLISPHVSKGSAGVVSVIDLCHTEEVCDIYEVPDSDETSHMKAIEDSSIIGNDLLNKLDSLEKDYSERNEGLFGASSTALPPPLPLPLPPLSQPEPRFTSSSSAEPQWDRMTDEELVQWAGRFGLRIESRPTLLRLLKAAWSKGQGSSRGSRKALPAMSAQELRQYLLESKEIYEKILLYVPVEVDEVHDFLQRIGHKISKANLLPLLDELAIFTSHGPRKG